MVNIVICDDENAFHEIIAYKTKQIMKSKFDMDFNITCFDKLDELKAYIDKNKVDILFLDIMINGENAMDWSIENIPNKYTQIIFMTSFPQYAYNISEANCCYYIAKSKMSDEILYRAIKRALQNTTKKDPNLTIAKSGKHNYIINYQDVLYIETFNNNIMLHLNDGSSITIYSTLKEYESQLPPCFLRCHKCYMVNMNHIARYEPNKFIFNTGETIPIPPKKYNGVIKIYRNYLLNI